MIFFRKFTEDWQCLKDPFRWNTVGNSEMSGTAEYIAGN